MSAITGIDIYTDAIVNIPSLTVNGSHVVALSLTVPGLQPSDAVLLISEFQLTSNLSYNVGIGRYIAKATSAMDAVGTPITQQNMDNLVIGSQTLSPVLQGADTGATGDVIYNVVVYGVSTGGSGVVPVTAGHGSLTAVVFRSASGINVVRDVTENVSVLQLNGSRAVILSTQATLLNPQDILLIISQFEVTNPFTYPVKVGQQIVRATSPTANVGTQLTPVLLTDVTANTHHKVFTLAAVDKAVTGTQFYNTVGVATAIGKSGNVNVEQGYGKLSTLIIRQ